jgi:NMD protein affecting ribosome stability and mRNA decay
MGRESVPEVGHCMDCGRYDEWLAKWGVIGLCRDCARRDWYVIKRRFNLPTPSPPRDAGIWKFEWGRVRP